MSDITDELTLSSCFVEGLKKFDNFKGRASKREYTGFSLYAMFLSIWIGVNFISIMYMILPDLLEIHGISVVFYIFLIVAPIYVPTIAVTVRRLHDVGKSGVHAIVPMVCFVAQILVLHPRLFNIGLFLVLFLVNVIISIPLNVVLARKGDVGVNGYGTDPLER